MIEKRLDGSMSVTFLGDENIAEIEEFVGDKLVEKYIDSDRELRLVKITIACREGLETIPVGATIVKTPVGTFYTLPRPLRHEGMAKDKFTVSVTPVETTRDTITITSHLTILREPEEGREERIRKALDHLCRSIWESTIGEGSYIPSAESDK